MGLASQFRETWDRMTGKSPEQPPAQSKPQEPQQSQKPLPTHEDLRRARGNEPRPAERLSPANAEKMREAAKHKPPPAPKPVEREAAKMQYTRTAQPAPNFNTPGGQGFVNRTSNFQQQKAPIQKAPPTPVKAPKTAKPVRTVKDFQRDDKAAEQQKQADKTGDGQRAIDQFRRPGQAPFDRSPAEAQDRVQKEQRMIDQFKQPSQEQSRSR